MALSYRFSLRGWAYLLVPVLLLFSLRTCSDRTGVSGCSRSTFQRPATNPGNGGGIATLPLAELPKHVRRVVEHLRSVRGFNPLKGYKGGRVFRNREGILPSGRKYYEYDVHPLRPELSRGAERLVVDEHKSIFYYTKDHYRTFTEILLP